MQAGVENPLVLARWGAGGCASATSPSPRGSRADIAMGGGRAGGDGGPEGRSHAPAPCAEGGDGPVLTRCHRVPFTTEGPPGLTRRPPRDCGSHGNYTSAKLLFKKRARWCSLRARPRQQNHRCRLFAKPPSPEGPGARTDRGAPSGTWPGTFPAAGPSEAGDADPRGRGGRGTRTGQHGAGAGRGPRHTAARPLPFRRQRRSAGRPPKWLLDSCVTNQSGRLQWRGLEQAGDQCEGHPAPASRRSAPSRC